MGPILEAAVTGDVTLIKNAPAHSRDSKE
jgi:hypothetical protein